MWQKRGPALLCLLLATALTVFAAASMTETLDEIITLYQSVAPQVTIVPS